jgi:elongation factor Tu
MRLLRCSHCLTLSFHRHEIVMLHVTARIRLLTTEEGGRTSSVCSGYRPNLRFGDLYTDGALTLLDRQQASPGDECDVCVTFVHPAYVQEHLRVGAHFEITEGPRKVGEGMILAMPPVVQNEQRESAEGQQDISRTLR